MKICRENPNSVEIGQKSGTLHEDLSVFHIIVSDIWRSNKDNALLRFHDNNRYANASQCYAIRTLPSFFFST